MRHSPPLQLRQLLLLRHLSTSSTPILKTHIPFPQNKPTLLPNFPNSQSPTITTPIFHILLKPFSTRPLQEANSAHLAQSISSELLRDPNAKAPAVAHRLQSTFPGVAPTPSLVQSVLNQSPDSHRRSVLGFHQWLLSIPDFDHTDETLSLFVSHFGAARDFKATHDVIVSSRNVAGPKTAVASFDSMARTGRFAAAVSFLDSMEKDYGIKCDRKTVKLVVDKVCEKPFVADKMVRRLANEVPKNVETFNVVIGCLCKLRRVADALILFGKMRGCQPDVTTFVTLIRGLYKAARIEEGDAMLERMKSAGIEMDNKAWYRILKTLCSVGRFEHAVSLVKRMKEEGCEPGVRIYLMMMEKLGEDYRVDKAVALTRPGELKRRPRLHKLHEPFKRKQKPVKQGETINEKVKRKRRRIKQVRLLFVKKPIPGLHRPL